MKLEENIRNFYIRSYAEHSAVYGPNTCIFLEVGSFYEMYDLLDTESGLGSTSMKKVVELLNIQLSMPKKNELFAGVPNYTLHKYASVLTKSGWTVVVINQVKNISKEKTEHPCQIPLELIKRIIRITAKNNDIIFDPFGGSGTTALAAYELGFDSIICEIDSDYMKIAKNRILN
jgi:DNA modification methylase